MLSSGCQDSRYIAQIFLGTILSFSFFLHLDIFCLLTSRPGDYIFPTHIQTWRLYASYSHPELEIIFFLLISSTGEFILLTHIQNWRLYSSYSYRDLEIVLFFLIARPGDCTLFLLISGPGDCILFTQI